MAQHPRSRLRARLVLAGLAACGLAALAWAAFVQPLPRRVYNPSDSVAVGWYRVDPLDHRTSSPPSPLSVGSIVLTRLPARRCRAGCAARLPAGARPAAQARGRGRTAARVHVRCVWCGSTAWRSAAVLPADRLGRPLPSWQQCRSLRPGELFLLSSANPASFDSRYFGPVSASAVIGVAHPVWLEKRP
jgi:type IV secretory pathway protease TraF